MRLVGRSPTKTRVVIYWHFAEVTKMKADIGVSEVEKQAAGSGRMHDVRQAVGQGVPWHSLERVRRSSVAT
jgi:hypothetical protein